MSSAQPTIPPDDPKRSLTLAQLEDLSHIGLVGDTYTIHYRDRRADCRTLLRHRHAHPARRRSATAPA
jgi:hypothetical protein